MKYVIAPVLLLAALAFGQSWVVEQVDSTAASGSPVELVKAADGRLCAGYGTRSGAARVACLTDSGWRFTDVCSSARLPSTAFRPFLAASTHGELCLACWDSIADANRLYRTVNDTWHSEPSPYNDSYPCNMVAYDTSGRLYIVLDPGWTNFWVAHETDSGWTCGSVVQLPARLYNDGPVVCLAAATDGSPWFFGFGGYDDGPPPLSAYGTDLLHFTGDSWVSAWHVYDSGLTPLPLALTPHGDGVGNLTGYYYGGPVRYDSLETIGWASRLTAGLAYTAGDIPVAAWIPSSPAVPTFAFRTDRWRKESIPGPAGVGGLDIEVDDSGQVVIVYSTQDSGLWCARGMDVLGVAESPKPQASSRKLGPTVLSGSSVQSLGPKVLFDAMGRRVANPRSGVFFVRDEGRGAGNVGRTRKVVVTR